MLLQRRFYADPATDPGGSAHEAEGGELGELDYNNMLDINVVNLIPYDLVPDCGRVIIVYEMTEKIFVIEGILWN